MKYMMMVKLDGNSESARNFETGMQPAADLEAAVGKLIEQMTRAGVLLDTGGLLPVSKGARIRALDGKLVVTDGPFIECKEVIGGYAIIRANSKEEAIKAGQDFMQLHLDILGASYESELEIRQMFDPEDFAAAEAKCQPQTKSAEIKLEK